MQNYVHRTPGLSLRVAPILKVTVIITCSTHNDR